MNERHEEFHEWAGAYALGALDPEDRRTFERHLAGCSRCAHEVRLLAPISGLLAQVDIGDLNDLTRTETRDAIAQGVVREERRVRSSRRRWRLAAIASAAATVLVVTAVAVAAFRSTDTADQGTQTVAADVTSSLAESTSVSTVARGWGTEIALVLGGLPQRTEYQLWAVDAGGMWTVAATWGPTGSGGAIITGATSVTTDLLDRVVVTSQDRNDVIIDATI